MWIAQDVNDCDLNSSSSLLSQFSWAHDGMKTSQGSYIEAVMLTHNFLVSLLFVHLLCHDAPLKMFSLVVAHGEDCSA